MKAYVIKNGRWYYSLEADNEYGSIEKAKIYKSFGKADADINYWEDEKVHEVEITIKDMGEVKK